MKPKYSPADILYSSEEDVYFMVMAIDKNTYIMLNLESKIQYPCYIDYIDSRIYIKLVA